MLNTVFNLLIYICLKPRAVRTLSVLCSQCFYLYSSQYLHSFCEHWLFIWQRVSQAQWNSGGSHVCTPLPKSALLLWSSCSKCVWLAVRWLGSPFTSAARIQKAASGRETGAGCLGQPQAGSAGQQLCCQCRPGHSWCGARTCSAEIRLKSPASSAQIPR